MRELEYLTLKLTNQCNLNCIMCGQVYSDNRKFKEQIRIDAIKNILKDATQLDHVYLFGGEPLMYTDISELLRLLHKRNVRVRITTNGTLLSKYAADIVKYEVNNVEISMDNYRKKALEHIRGKNVYHRILDGISTLVSMKQQSKSLLPNVNINW